MQVKIQLIKDKTDLLNANFTSHDELHSMFDNEKSTVKVDCVLDGKSDFGNLWRFVSRIFAASLARRDVTWPRGGEMQRCDEAITNVSSTAGCGCAATVITVTALFLLSRKRWRVRVGSVELSWAVYAVLLLLLFLLYVVFCNKSPATKEFHNGLHYYTLIAPCFCTRAIWRKRFKIIPFSKIHLYSNKLRMLTVVLSTMCSKISKN